MSYNNTALMETVNNFILPDADFSENFSNEDFAEDFDGLQVNFPRVKIPGGGAVSFEVPGDDPESPDSVKIIEGIIVYNHAAGLKVRSTMTMCPRFVLRSMGKQASASRAEHVPYAR